MRYPTKIILRNSTKISMRYTTKIVKKFKVVVSYYNYRESGILIQVFQLLVI